MAQATLSVRIGKEDKLLFEQFCNQTGMNVSTAINMYIKNVIQHQKLPFAVALKDPFYNPENMAHLKASIEDLEKTGGTIHELAETD